jgi:hypothetical protein
MSRRFSSAAEADLDATSVVGDATGHGLLADVAVEPVVAHGRPLLKPFRERLAEAPSFVAFEGYDTIAVLAA